LTNETRSVSDGSASAAVLSSDSSFIFKVTFH
jgi:hypothetical protein